MYLAAASWLFNGIRRRNAKKRRQLWRRGGISAGENRDGGGESYGAKISIRGQRAWQPNRVVVCVGPGGASLRRYQLAAVIWLASSANQPAGLAVIWLRIVMRLAG
jgi:hypothetical protein